MTAQLELERILDDFLGEGTDELSADVLEAALLDVRYTDQRRAHPVPRRTDDVSPPLRLLAVAAILVAAVGGAVMLGNSIRNDATPTPALTPMPNANPLPSAADDGPMAIGANVHGRWTASRPAAFASPAGDYDLDFPDDGALTATARNGEVRRLVRGEVKRLPDREKMVLSLYYDEGLTLAEIGGVLGVTESRVSQIHTKAVLHLRARLSASGVT